MPGIRLFAKKGLFGLIFVAFHAVGGAVGWWYPPARLAVDSNDEEGSDSGLLR